MQEQERVANEKAEKDLKAALKAKREPTTSTSRVASPTVGATTITDISAEPKVLATENTSTDDINMETDTEAVRSNEVSPLSGQILINNLQGPWLPELSAIFDDIKKIAPGNAYEVIGLVCPIV